MHRTRTGGRKGSLRGLGGALLLTGVLAGSVAGGGVVRAAVGGAGDAVINACVNPQSGRIQIAARPDACQPNERSLSWNQQGVAGPPGLAGPRAPRAEG